MAPGKIFSFTKFVMIGFFLFSSAGRAGVPTSREVLEVTAARHPHENIILASWAEVLSGGFVNLNPKPESDVQCGLSTSRNEGATWSPPIYHKFAAGYSGFNPTVAVSSQGTFYAVCMSVKDDYSAGVLEMTYSHDAGRTWSPWQTIVQSVSGVPDKPTLTVNGDRLILTYANIQSAPLKMRSSLKILESGLNGFTWKEIEPPFFAKSFLTDIPGRFQITGENTVAVLPFIHSKEEAFLWGEYRGDSGDGGIWFSRRQANGSFSTSLQLAREVMDPPVVSLYSSPNEKNILALWFSAHAREKRGLAGAFSADGGLTWGPRTLIAEDGLMPAAVVYDNGSYAVAHTVLNDNAALLALRTMRPFRPALTQQMSIDPFDIHHFSYVGNTVSLLKSKASDRLIYIGVRWKGGKSYFDVRSVKPVFL